MDKMTTQEMISALADGELRGDAFAQGVHVAALDRASLEAWSTYHLIGDALRAREVASGMPPSDFLACVRASLLKEPVPGGGATWTGSRAFEKTDAANDGSFRWKLVAGFSSLAAVAVIGWNVAGMSTKPEQAQLAAAPSVVAPVVATAANNEKPVMIRDPHLDELLAAHRQFVGATALHSPAGFVRNATFEAATR